MEPIDSIHSDFIADICLIPDTELIRIRFEHPDVSGTIFLKKSIKKSTYCLTTRLTRSFLNVIKKYIYEVHYENSINTDNNVDVSKLLLK